MIMEKEVERTPIEYFVKQVPAKLSKFFESYGFRRNESFEEVSEIGAVFCYVGVNVGFFVYLEYIEDLIGTSVGRVTNGSIVDDLARSRDLLLYLIKHEEYKPDRERLKTYFMHPDYRVRLERELTFFIELLETAGQKLLADRPDSLQ